MAWMTLIKYEATQVSLPKDFLDDPSWVCRTFHFGTCIQISHRVIEKWIELNACSPLQWIPMAYISWFGWSWIAGDHPALIRTSPLHGGWMWVAREWKVWTEMRRLCCLICGRWAIWFKLCFCCTPAGLHNFTVWVLGFLHKPEDHRNLNHLSRCHIIWCAEVLNVLRLLQGFGFLPYLSTFQDTFKCRARDW